VYLSPTVVTMKADNNRAVKYYLLQTLASFITELKTHGVDLKLKVSFSLENSLL
jgi:hypothetical protein